MNGARSNRHNTASRRGVTGVRVVNPVKRDRRAQRLQSGQACASRSTDGRKNEKSDRQVLAVEKANGPDIFTVGAHSGRIARPPLIESLVIIGEK
ncbi:MAG: hypothetical protein M5U15_11425 [Kiritimatiellae bacterium]|nr:hypothetical protein [Kiritimatiellia bacterium]